jgi:hypothetical protein
VCALGWRPEPNTSGEDATISESAASTTERRPEESEATTEGIEWFEWPEEPEITWTEEPEESAASAGIREAVKYLLEDAFEGAEKATGAWAKTGRMDPWRSGESFAEWQTRVAATLARKCLFIQEAGGHIRVVAQSERRTELVEEGLRGEEVASGRFMAEQDTRGDA